MPRVVPAILVATAAATPAIGAVAVQMVAGSLASSVVPISLGVIAAATWITYVTGRHADRVARRIARLEAAVRVSHLDTGSLRRLPLRKVD